MNFAIERCVAGGLSCILGYDFMANIINITTSHPRSNQIRA